MPEEFVCDHIFKITFSHTRFEALITKACREPFLIELVGHDPTLVPQVRLYNVGFSTPEDRDRVRIAMRFLEKEHAAAASSAPRNPAISGKFASA